jgi:hypothetical protein
MYRIHDSVLCIFFLAPVRDWWLVLLLMPSRVLSETVWRRTYLFDVGESQLTSTGVA